MQISTPRIIALTEAPPVEAGGKALGLARLARMGLQIPAGFVVVGAEPGRLPEGLDQAYRELGGGPVAVRSSATDEDGESASFAGQFDTILGVEGKDAVRQAVERCLASLHSERADAYISERKGNGNGRSMSVVVQQMVEARAAGVLFTVDPVTAVKERVVVDAVAGLGESLVSGHASPDQFVLTRDGDVRNRTLANESPVVSDDELRAFTKEAIRAEARWGSPLDLEWAVDADGNRFWLQARPITTLADDLDEIPRHHGPEDVFTTANISEMMPGAVNPLTLTTSFWAVDQGMQEMQVRYGGLEARREGCMITGIFYGHLFINLTSMANLGRSVAGQTPDTLSLALCGRHVPELKVGPKANALIQAINAFKYVTYILLADREIREFVPLVDSFRIQPRPTMEGTYRAIDAGRQFLFEVVHMHLHSSAGSGSLIGVIEAVLTKGKPPTPEDQAALITSLGNAGGVESAELVDDLERVIESIATDPEWADSFCEMTTEEALKRLRHERTGRVGRAFAAFLKRHGHRSWREADLRQPSWADEPLSLVTSMQVSASSWTPERRRRRDATDQLEDQLAGRIPGWMIRYARHTVRNREKTKSMMIATIDQFKRAFRHLAHQMVEAELLPEADLIYFLTHREVGQLVFARDLSLVSRARARRRIHELQGALQFADISVGEPEPMDPMEGVSFADGVLQGRPASHGLVEGTARVVLTAQEAASVQPGEILVAPVTDVGWTPYFSIIGGLATDIGSPISHGAVVAREYKLPAVVNLRIATKTFQTGDRVILDGTRGTLRLA
jgi:pyruvate,water dikinase